MQHGDFLPASQPLLWDSKSCEAWLAKVPLADPRQACTAFIDLLDELEDAPPRQPAYLEILETLRPAIELSQGEYAKRFVAKPLPLAHAELVAFDQVCDLWHALMSAYRRLADASLNGVRPELAATLPLLGQRAIHYLTHLMHEHMRARREVEPELWQTLNRLYAHAEEHGYAADSVDIGSKRHPQITSCRASYASALLLALANPYGVNSKQLAWTWRLARRLAHKLELTDVAHEAGGYAVDLAHDAGPCWLAAAAAGGAGIRYLGTRELGRSLRRRLKKIEAGIEPAELGLSRDCTAQAAAQLLNELHRAWAATPRVHKYPRRHGSNPSELASGFTAIHFALSGKLFEQDDSVWSYSRQNADRMHIFQHTEAHTDKVLEARLGLAAESWETLDESALGFRLKRGAGGARLTQDQLVALKPAGAKHFLLCEVRWLMLGLDASLIVGVMGLPGLPHAAAVRNVRPATEGQEKFRQAFLLPEAQGAPACMILPAGWHQPERRLELQYSQTMVKVRLGELLQRGYDYDRVSFSISD